MCVCVCYHGIRMYIHTKRFHVHKENRVHAKRSLANEPKRFLNAKELGYRRQWSGLFFYS